MKSRIACLIVAGLMLASVGTAGYAQDSTDSGTSVGQVEIDARDNVLHPGVIVFNDAHVTGKNGMTIDADTITAYIKSNSLEMTGHFKAHINRAAESEDITVTADKAVYNQSVNQVILSGDVVYKMYTTYTVGPLIQTGDSAVMQLGKGPDYPVITMTNVHTTFTPGH